jgi:hypothetical protein
VDQQHKFLNNNQITELSEVQEGVINNHLKGAIKSILLAEVKLNQDRSCQPLEKID